MWWSRLRPTFSISAHGLPSVRDIYLDSNSKSKPFGGRKKIRQSDKSFDTAILTILKKKPS
ncbi:hypothetical protein CUMW_044050, partial [Citrus unshiu]